MPHFFSNILATTLLADAAREAKAWRKVAHEQLDKAVRHQVDAQTDREQKLYYQDQAHEERIRAQDLEHELEKLKITEKALRAGQEHLNGVNDRLRGTLHKLFAALDPLTRAVALSSEANVAGLSGLLIHPDEFRIISDALAEAQAVYGN